MTAPLNFKDDLFLSYASQDEEFALALAKALAAHGIAVWIAPVSLYGGDKWRPVIIEALQHSEHLLYLAGNEPGPYQLWEHEKFLDLSGAAPSRHVIPLQIGRRLPRNLGTETHIVKWSGESPRELSDRFAGYPAVGRRGTAAKSTHRVASTYLSTLAEQNRTIEIKGFETKLRTLISLEELYVPLQTGFGHRGGMGADSAIKGARKADVGPGSEANASRGVPLIDAFRVAGQLGRHGVILLGDPGSGKTTHLRRVAYLLATGEAAKLGLPETCVPVLLALRNLTTTARGLEPFIEAEFRSAFSRLPAGFATQLLAQGNIVYLLDGLDEVPPSRRAEIVQWVEKGLRTSHDARFLVTSRFAGYTEDARFGAEFLELHLSPLDDKGTETLVQNWYRAVELGLDPDHDQANRRATAKSKELLDLIAGPRFQTRSLREMVGNPLLLTAICLVHRDRARLPERRVELYDECVNVLLQHWRGAKGLEIAVDAALARRILQPLALWLHEKDQRTRATATELQPILTTAIGRTPCSITDPDTFLATIRDQSGLLTGFSGKTFGFMHLGFQEYLAACEIQNRAFDEPALLAALVAHFGDPWWREVTMLLFALSGPSPFKAFFRLLCQSQAFVDHRPDVVACLEEAVAFSPEPFVELLQTPHSKDQALWSRHAVALWILQRRAPEALLPLSAHLRKHPSPEINGHDRIPAEAQSPITRSASSITKLCGLEFVTIPAGSFIMGSPETDEDRDNDELQYVVYLSAFQLARTPVTSADYANFLEATKRKPHEYWSNRAYNQATQPVVGVDWDDAVAFCKWVGPNARLPSEAEWEYACRAGTQTRFWSGDSPEDLARVGWFSGNSGGRLHPVAELPANPYGLHDMHGNVDEWCADWFGDYPRGIQKDPQGPPSGSVRVRRGGFFGDGARWCRSACRSGLGPSYRGNYLGFRVAVSLPSS